MKPASTIKAGFLKRRKSHIIRAGESRLCKKYDKHLGDFHDGGIPRAVDDVRVYYSAMGRTGGGKTCASYCRRGDAAAGPSLRFADGLNMNNSKACAVQAAQAEEIQTPGQQERIASKLEGPCTATSTLVVQTEPCMDGGCHDGHSQSTDVLKSKIDWGP
jgi:hypothetical protein